MFSFGSRFHSSQIWRDRAGVNEIDELSKKLKHASIFFHLSIQEKIFFLKTHLFTFWQSSPWGRVKDYSMKYTACSIMTIKLIIMFFNLFTYSFKAIFKEDIKWYLYHSHIFFKYLSHNALIEYVCFLMNI